MAKTNLESNILDNSICTNLYYYLNVLKYFYHKNNKRVKAK